jgi:4-hydroxy-4-methyl-2-oxoglutarate aldolase
MPGQNTSAADLAQLSEVLFTGVVADVLDTLGYRNQSPRVQLRPMTGVAILVGRCKTTLWEDIFQDDPHTYDMELAAIDACQPGDVFIAAAGGSTRSAIWGQLLSTAAHNAGCVGTIVHGTVRDVPQTTRLGYGVFALGTSPYDSMNRQKVVAVDVPVEIAGVSFHPGDLVFADVDGVVVVPREVERQTIERALAKVSKENEILLAIQGGLKATEAWKKYGVL